MGSPRFFSLGLHQLRASREVPDDSHRMRSRVVRIDEQEFQRPAGQSIIPGVPRARMLTQKRHLSRTFANTRLATLEPAFATR